MGVNEVEMGWWVGGWVGWGEVGCFFFYFVKEK